MIAPETVVSLLSILGVDASRFLHKSSKDMKRISGSSSLTLVSGIVRSFIVMLSGLGTTLVPNGFIVLMMLVVTMAADISPVSQFNLFPHMLPTLRGTRLGTEI